jgi:hypothetical protein
LELQASSGINDTICGKKKKKIGSGDGEMREGSQANSGERELFAPASSIADEFQRQKSDSLTTSTVVDQNLPEAAS